MGPATGAVFESTCAVMQRHDWPRAARRRSTSTASAAGGRRSRLTPTGSRPRPAAGWRRTRSTTSPPARATSTPSPRTGRRFTAGESCRACCATSSTATPASSCSGNASPARSCSPRSACSSSPTPKRIVPWRAQRGTRARRWCSRTRRRSPWRASPGSSATVPHWFQLYWSRSDELVESLVARAERCGCRAIAVTLDTTMLGWRSRDLEGAYLPFLHGKGIAQYTSDPVFKRIITAPTTPDPEQPQPRADLRRASHPDRAHPRLPG